MSDIHRIVPINTDSISSSTPYVDISGNYYTNDNQRPQTEIDELDLSSTDDVPLAPTTEFGYYNLSAIDDTYVETEYETGAITSDEPESLWSSLTNWWDDVTDWWTDDRPLIEKIGSAFLITVQAVGATIVEVPISLLEGVAQVGEAIFDFITLLGTGITSVGTGIYDAYQAIHSLQTGEEWESLTISTWENTMAFVSESHVTNLFDSFYRDNPIGQWISENALFFDTTRSIGSGIGYVAGIIALTVATWGVAGAALAGGSVTVSSAVAATTTTQMALTATAAGIGMNAQNAWANGANLVEGLISGTLGGVWEGFQFFIGGKISGLTLFGKDGILKSITSSELGTKLLNSFIRVILDGVDGGVEGIVLPLIESIYKDGYYDESGNYIEFSENDNIFDRYSEIFDDNGGWSNVLTQATIGAGLSLLGEAFDLRRYFNQSERYTKIETSIRNIDNKDSVCDLLKNMEPAEVLEFLEHTDLSSYSYEQLWGIDDWCVWSAFNHGTQVGSIIRKVDEVMSQIEENNRIIEENNKKNIINNWIETEMISTLVTLFSPYHDEFYIRQHCIGSARFLTGEEFAEELVRRNLHPNAAAFNDGHISTFNLADDINHLRSRAMHENTHQISYVRFKASDTGYIYIKQGFQLTIYDPTTKSYILRSEYRGFNEAVTDMFTKMGMKENYCEGGYTQAVERLQQIIDLNIPNFSLEEIKKRYLFDIIDSLVDAIDSVAGQGFLKNELIPAFDLATNPDTMDSGLAILDQLIAKLQLLVS